MEFFEKKLPHHSFNGYWKTFAQLLCGYNIVKDESNRLYIESNRPTPSHQY